MRVPSKSVINLIGGLGLALILVAGLLVGVAPLVAASFDLRAQTRATQATNNTFQAQLATLQSEQANIARIERELAELRREIPAADNADEVVEEIVRAATAAGGVIDRITVELPEAWSARTATEAEELLERRISSAPAADSTAEAGATPDPQASAPAPDDTGESGATPAPQASALQLPVQITVELPDAAAFAALLDQLAASERLLDVSRAVMTPVGSVFRAEVDVHALVANGGR